MLIITMGYKIMVCSICKNSIQRTSGNQKICKECKILHRKILNKNVHRKYYLKNDGIIKKKNKQYNKDNPLIYKIRHLKKLYKLSYEDYLLKLESCDYKCEICNIDIIAYNINGKSNNTAHVDHCHESGINRGLLCGRCNSILGYSKENINILQNSINYLIKYNKQNDFNFIQQ